jgi:hypothetical protein
MERWHLYFATVLISLSLGGLIAYVELEQFCVPSVQVFEINAPITHSPTFLGSYSFVLGGKNLFQNDTAYSYVWINASAIRRGDSFTVFPALNVGLKGQGMNENNFTVKIVYSGSNFGSSPYWLNFSVFISAPRMNVNSSQLGFSSTLARSNVSVPGSNGAEFFTQISDVVNSYDEFEYFFYIGNVTTPVPDLTHGPVH